MQSLSTSSGMADGNLSNLKILLVQNVSYVQFYPQNSAISPVDRNRVTLPSDSAHFSTTFPISISLSFPLPLSDALRRREEGGSSVYRSSHHLWNFRARPRWKGVLCPPDEECPCVAPQRKGFIWPGIWRHLEKCRGDFLGGGDGKLKAFIRLDSRRTALPKLVLNLYDTDRLVFTQ